MWVFYLISLPLTTGMVLFTLRYFAGPDVPRYVLFTVGYTWFCSLSIIILVPADIWAVISPRKLAICGFQFDFVVAVVSVDQFILLDFGFCSIEVTRCLMPSLVMKSS